MNFSHEFLLFCAVLACYNLGTIWFAQLVIYPLFAKVGSKEYTTYRSSVTPGAEKSRRNLQTLALLTFGA